jgi:PIN domain
MARDSQFHVLLDANIWVAERLLQSSLGSALLYALTGSKASIVLPEVVELEVNRVLPELAEKAVGVIGREASLLRQLSGHNLLFTGPSAVSIEDGIKDRWQKLDGLLLRVPFTYEQARSALNRVLQKSPPSGDNNEQFRDCCIWDAAFFAASDRPVHCDSALNSDPFLLSPISLIWCANLRFGGVPIGPDRDPTPTVLSN